MDELEGILRLLLGASVQVRRGRGNRMEFGQKEGALCVPALVLLSTAV